MSRKAFEKGIDISKYNTVRSFYDIKNSGFYFVMIRCGGTEDVPYSDPKFEEYYRGSKDAKLKVGTYYVLPTHPKAGREFLHLLDLIKGKSFEYPIALDIELLRMEDKTENSRQIAMLAEMLEKAGYYVILYSNPNYFRNYLDMDVLSKYDLWVAAWSSTESKDYQGGMWQHSARGIVEGVIGDVDLDISFYDYLSIMKCKGLNLYPFDNYTNTDCCNDCVNMNCFRKRG